MPLYEPSTGGAGRALAGDGVHTELRTAAVAGATIVAPLLLGLGASAPLITCDVVRGSDLLHVSSLTSAPPAAGPPSSKAAKKSKVSAAASPAGNVQRRAINLTASMARVATISPALEASPSLPSQAVTVEPSRVVRGVMRRMIDGRLVTGPADRGCAALAVDVKTHGAGYVSHPAAVDASMHIDAALAEVVYCPNNTAGTASVQPLCL